ncbi:MAG: hypothetical protein LBK28_09355 [Propionibacteriaceae bacterium]|jgi:hypothetical protein|nr:hypothetical protein [Propionibacteriaceae bacterium]
MSNQVQSYGGGGVLPLAGAGGLPSPLSQTGRAIGRVQNQGLVRAAAIDVETTLSRVKLSGATSLARTAQSEVAMLTAVEAELIKAVPLAGNRLEFLGNMASIQVAEMLADDLTKLRRM